MQPKRQLTKDGFEMTFGVNHVGTFYVTNLLLKNIKKGGRIVVVSSFGHYFGKINFDDLQCEKEKFDTANVYNMTKLSNVLFTKELQRRLNEEGSDITVNSIHPGLIFTNILKPLTPSVITEYLTCFIFYLIGKTPFQGAQTSVYAAISKELEGKGGLYLSDCQIKKESGFATQENGQQLWEITQKLINNHFEKQSN